MPTHRLFIPTWRPAPLNTLLGNWRKSARLKKSDREIVGGYWKESGLPKATGKRKVSLVVTLGPRQNPADRDAYWKSCFDALVHCGALVNDTCDLCEQGDVVHEKFAANRLNPGTLIILEDV